MLYALRGQVSLQGVAGRVISTTFCTRELEVTSTSTVDRHRLTRHYHSRYNVVEMFMLNMPCVDNNNNT